MTLERLLQEQRDDIVARFVEEVRRKDLPPEGLSHSVLVDHIPKFLDEILAARAGTPSTRVRPRDAMAASGGASDTTWKRWCVSTGSYGIAS